MRETVQQGNGFVMKEDGQVVAEVTYIPQEDALLIDHTFVSESLRGQKVGEELVRRVVQHARESNLKVVPACSYAHALFKRHQEFSDIWKQ